MLQFAVTGKAPAPMPARDNPWAVYDVFTVKDGEQIFLAAVSDPQWETFCDALGFADLKADPALATNNLRVQKRATLLKTIGERIAQRSAAELAALFERVGLPFAPIRRPEDLYDDPHLAATGGLADVRLPDGARAGQSVKTTLFPFTLGGTTAGRAARPAADGRAHARASRLDRLRWRGNRCTARAARGRLTRSRQSVPHGGPHDPTQLPPLRSRSLRDRGRDPCRDGPGARAARRAAREIHPPRGDRLGRRHDHARGPARAVEGAERADRRRQPAGRGRHRRHVGAREVGARRLHAVDRVEQPRDLPERLQVAAVRSDRRHHADRRHRLDADRHRRQSESAREERAGADRAAQGESRQVQLRLVRQRHDPAPRGRDVLRRGRASRRRTCRTRASARC